MKFLSEPPIIALAKRIMDPSICGLTFLAFICFYRVPWDSYLSILFIAAILFSWIISQMLRPLLNFRGGNDYSYIAVMLLGGSIFIFLIYSLFLNTQYARHLQRPIMTAWLVSMPFFLLAAHGLLHIWLKNQHQKIRLRKSVIVGATRVGYQLSCEILKDPSLLIQVEGFFDAREPNRIMPECREKVLGGFDKILPYVKAHGIQVVFIALPVGYEERMTHLLDELRDTTSSIYLVPDISGFNLIQSRVDAIHDIPVVSLLESPIQHLNAIWKAAFDFFGSICILLFISPLLVFITLIIKLSSPGPVLFKQSRYGLDGREIKVYKFRTMNVCENGPSIQQATKDDPRIYPFGAFLRKTSLDELPQFFNVVKGDMSIVGPRPHAVAHNEEYRKRIHGYMLRHKVKPGITGWAQVHGLRGETETLDKMEKRVEYDLEYLRSWTMLLDILIIIRTFGVVFQTTNAH
ncbi:undecaprenyl-phosphate glucose phosphotransferase [Methylomicrobium sp. Wu6]|uniref:undecaprenyl-phosphate glucose phosphotransferase n=1 Tax=Methylomicrobium sp. Wu6 TaxID=3107928 RepID=UPI002DD63670|nr:undecaprenyl-phosphate glucose phosphotransferase [Methylomicrobium sp. Wu6]MEC4747785.1 undecaprenyl-phosphate glucose phosphotransferase [Methylomicrobium sp. Wu6]